MSDETLRWKLFLFSLTERANQWCNKIIGSLQGDWEMLCSKFCLSFFLISRVVSLRIEVPTFKQKEKESLGASWDHFNSLITTSLDLGISDPMLLPHFYMGLSKDSAQSLDIASRGAFLCLSVSEARTILDKIIGNTPCSSMMNSPRKRRNHPLNQNRKF
jgi:hypothetical protein